MAFISSTKLEALTVVSKCICICLKNPVTQHYYLPPQTHVSLCPARVREGHHTVTCCLFGTAVIAICIVTDINPSAKVTAQKTVSFPAQYSLLSRAYRSNVLRPFLTLMPIFLLTHSNLLVLPPHPLGDPLLLGKSVKRQLLDRLLNFYLHCQLLLSTLTLLPSSPYAAVAISKTCPSLLALEI